MRWFSRLFRKAKEVNSAAPRALSATPATTTKLPPPQPASTKAPVFSRSTPNPQHAAQGQERATYLSRIAKCFSDIGAIDPTKPFDELGLDELDVSECIQMAEEVWGVQLMPNPMTMSDFAEVRRRFPDLNAIAAEAEAATNVATPRGLARPSG
jgi:hypothetical protein